MTRMAATPNSAPLPTPAPSALQGVRGSPPRSRTAERQDVWTRAGADQRWRAFLLLLVNLLLFCGLCVFTHWLHVAKPFEFTWSSYAEPARFWDGRSPNLNDFILYPISVERTPIHAVVLGLLVASIVTVPIVISILFRFPCALPFVAAVAIFAHMPWMAITLLGSCLLASVRPFRLNFRYGAALVGLLPVLLYLFLASRSADPAGATSPNQTAVLAAPWILAILAACGMAGVILYIARLVDFRPGAVAPVVAVMFATPVLLFHTRVGVDELSYRVLEHNHGPRSRTFEPLQNAEPELRRVAPRLFTDDELYERYRPFFLGMLQGDVGPLRRLILRQMLSEFLHDRAVAYEACNKFIADHPGSHYLPNVLYIQARVLDTRLDERMLQELRRELYHDYPHVQSETIWSNLLKHTDSPLALAAAVRLAELRLRKGEITQAREALQSVIDNRAWAQGDGDALRDDLDFEPRPFAFEARRMAELIDANAADPRYGAAPLVELATLDARRAGYLSQLQALIHRYQDAALYDNLLIRWATSLPSGEDRGIALTRIIEEKRLEDALPEALLRLADIEIQTLSRGDPAALQRGLERLRRVRDEFSLTCWRLEAEARLEAIAPRVVLGEQGS